MFAKSMPELLVTVEDTGKEAEAIKKGGLDSGRIIADPAQMALQAAATNGVPIELAHDVRKAEAYYAMPKSKKKLKPAQIRKALTELGLVKAIKLFPDPKVYEPQPYTPPEPTKASVESQIKWKLTNLKDLQETAWQIRSLCSEDKGFEALKDVMESRYQSIVSEIKELAGKHGKLKKSLIKGDGLNKAIAFLTGGDPTEAELKDNHSESWHSDADKEVVAYLTTIEKIDLTSSPTHNPAVVPGPQSGFPRPLNRSVEEALDLVKSFDNKPPMAGRKVRKPKKDPEQVKQERAQERDLGVKKSRPTLPAFDRHTLMAKAFGWEEPA